MIRKNNPNVLKAIYTSAQIFVLLMVTGILLWVSALSHKEDVLEIFSNRLDTSAETMANQLKSNQVPSSLGPEGQGVFIINQNDGVIVIDKHLGTDVQQEEWQRYRSKLIYEMQKQKRGWIVYPEKKPWQVHQMQRVIRYLAIEELGWILAVEAPRPTDFQLLCGAFKKTSYLFIAGLLLSGILAIWLINERYFFVIWRSITDTVENNFMSLSGEDSIWDKFKTSGKGTHDLEKEALGLGFQQEKIRQNQVEAIYEKSVPAVESLRTPQEAEQFLPIDVPLPTPKPEVKQENKPEFKLREPVLKEEAEIKKDEPKDFNQLTINVNDIKSPALKKIIKQFREK